jgi:(p)ppGpp synthase/HD superfamily hydrolase
MTDLIAHARLFATAAHAAVGQLRKYTDEPYIVHPVEVMEIVRSVPHDDGMLAAALLHDVLEDTAVTANLLTAEFGEDVASLVQQVTDVSRPEDGNRRVRKELDRQHIARASARAKTVKLADLISNSGTIVEYDPGFARVYMKEKEALLAVLHEGDAALHARARAILDRANATLGNGRA